MAFLTFDQLNEQQGTDTGNALRNAANAAANLVCELYEQYPKGIIPQLGDPTGIGDFNQGLADSLCRPRGKEPGPPSVPFQGGQCPNVTYAVTYTYSGEGVPNGGGTVFLVGPIGPPIVRETNRDNLGPVFLGSIPNGGGVFNAFSNLYASGFGEGPPPFTITNVVRTGGFPDTCGNPAPVYPNPLPPPTAFDRPAPVGPPGAVVTVPVTLIPVLFRPDISFRPEFNVDVGGVSVNFNLGGVDININPPGGNGVRSPSVDPRPNPPTPIAPRSPQPGTPECNLGPVIDLLEDIKDCACEEDGNIVEVALGTTEGGCFTLPAKTVGVRVSGNFSVRVKTQVGSGTAPDVRFAGWIAFGTANSPGQRIPLDFASATFFNPPDASAVCVSINYGGTASLVALTRP